MAASPRSSSPLHGYDSEGEEPGHGEQEAATPTKKRLRSGRARTASNPARDRRGRFTSRRGASLDKQRTDDDTAAESDLGSVDSLAWDAQQEQLDATTGTRRWSSGTQYSVPIDTDSEDDQLSAVEEGRESRASAPLERQPPAAVIMADVPHHRAEIARALMEIDDDIAPFMGRQVSATCIAGLIEKANALKRTLQAGHLYLTANDAAAYAELLDASVTDNRRTISGFIVDLEEARAVADATDAATTAATAREAAAAGHRLNPAKQDLIRGRGFVRLKTWARNHHTGAFLAATAASAGMARTRRPSASRRRLSRPSLRTACSWTLTTAYCGRPSPSSRTP